MDTISTTTNPTTPDEVAREKDAIKEREKKITALMASTYGFTRIAKGWKCNFCGRRLMDGYIGEHINDRMYRHYSTRHGRI